MNIPLKEKLIYASLFILAFLGFYTQALHKAVVDFENEQNTQLIESIKHVSPVKEAEAAEPEVEPAPAPKATIPLPPACEQYRGIVEFYFGSLTDEALFTASHESGCNAKRASNGNDNGTRDFCLFRINSEPATEKNLDLCVKRAYDKYVEGRIGRENWSAFYAVCDVTTKPKYPSIINNCN